MSMLYKGLCIAPKLSVELRQSSPVVVLPQFPRNNKVTVYAGETADHHAWHRSGTVVSLLKTELCKGKNAAKS